LTSLAVQHIAGHSDTRTASPLVYATLQPSVSWRAQTCLLKSCYLPLRSPQSVPPSAGIAAASPSAALCFFLRRHLAAWRCCWAATYECDRQSKACEDCESLLGKVTSLALHGTAASAATPSSSPPGWLSTPSTVSLLSVRARTCVTRHVSQCVAVFPRCVPRPPRPGTHSFDSSSMSTVSNR